MLHLSVEEVLKLKGKAVDFELRNNGSNSEQHAGVVDVPRVRLMAADPQRRTLDHSSAWEGHQPLLRINVGACICTMLLLPAGRQGWWTKCELFMLSVRLLVRGRKQVQAAGQQEQGANPIWPCYQLLAPQSRCGQGAGCGRCC